MDEAIRLSSNTTIKKYRKMEESEDKDGLAKFIYERLSERYIKPVASGEKNGFAIMACACLLVETMESFQKGWKTTNKKGRGKRAFRQFIQRWPRFSPLVGYEAGFYENVRCGILHQGETRAGWRVTRNSSCPVFAKGGLVINATKFLNRLDHSLRDYAAELKKAEWNQIVWRNFRQKMDSIVANCEGRIHA
jgi:hypothetical protein